MKHWNELSEPAKEVLEILEAGGIAHGVVGALKRRCQGFGWAGVTCPGANAILGESVFEYAALCDVCKLVRQEQQERDRIGTI